MLLRHDWVTLYANGIRYLEKAPLLYWSMAASMRVAQLLGHGSARCLAVAARIPLALTVLALAFAVEAFARRAFRSHSRRPLRRAILLSRPASSSSPASCCPTRCSASGSRSRYALLLADGSSRRVGCPIQAPLGWDRAKHRLLCYAFAACCALGVLTKGLIGVVFPVRHRRDLPAADARPARSHRAHPANCTRYSSRAVFLAIAAPWHIAHRARPTRRAAIPASSPSRAATGTFRCPPTATSTAGPGSTSSTSSCSATSTCASPATTTLSRSGSSGASASSGSCRGPRSCSRRSAPRCRCAFPPGANVSARGR